MTKNLKKSFKSFYSAKVVCAGIALIALTAVFIFYAIIPLPNISDGYLPGEVRKVSYSAPLIVHFSQPMQRLSVEENFSVNPKLEGRFKWADSQTLEYHPNEELTINDEYTVVIRAKAKNIYYKALGVDFELRFMVSGSPYIKFISPYPYAESIQKKTDHATEDAGTAEIGFVEEMLKTEFPATLIIPNDQRITVMFDRPIRALTTLDESSSSQGFPELKIIPPVKGSYRWVGTTAFQFIPDEWTMSTDYTLSLQEGITALDGGQTEEGVVWSLATDSPKVINTEPYNDHDAFPVNGDISITFNQPMELDNIRPSDNALLYPSNDADADKNPRNDGFFNTEVVYGKDEDGKTDKTTLVFRPEFSYQYDTDYKFVLKAGLEGAAYKLGGGYGERFMEDDIIIDFHTIKQPDIISFQPANGEQNYAENHISIQFASPMSKELIEGLFTMSPKPEKNPEVSVYQVQDEEKGTVWEAHITYDLEPSRYYNFEFKGHFKDIYGNESSKGFRTSFKTAPRKPYLGLMGASRFGLFMEGVRPGYTIRTVNIDNADVQLCAMTEQEFFTVNQNYEWHKYKCAAPERKTVNIKNKLNSVDLADLDLQDIFGRNLKKGIYFFEISSRQYPDHNGQPYRYYQIFFITDTGMAVKKSGQDTLVWATDLKTGKPVSRMDIRVMSYSGKELQRGVTDGSGAYKISKDFDDNVYILASKNLEGENRWSIVSQYWNDGIQPWEFSAGGQWIGMDEPRIYLYTERPIYRPGDEVFYKGIYRVDRDARLSLPTDKKVRIVIEDPEYNEIDSHQVTLLADGSFDGSIKLNDAARLGQFNIYAETIGHQYPQRFYYYFFVEEYKKPKFKVEMLTPYTEYQAGQDAHMDIMASYYFGGAISEGDVQWTLMREPYVFNKYKGDDYYSFGAWQGFMCFWDYCGSLTQISAEGQGKLDSNGRLRLKLPADDKAELGGSYLYTLNAEIKNKDGETVSKRESYIVHMGSYYIGLSPKSYITEPGGKLNVKLITVDPDGAPVSGKKINIELYREKWNTVKKQGVDGNYYEESERELVFVKKKSATSSAEPAEIEIDIDSDMEGGSYVARAKGSDGKNEVVSETSFYVSSYAYVDWGSSNNNRMELVPDQPEYYVGGKAKILIKSPYGSEEDPVKALVTYERAGIQNYQVIDIKSNSDTIDVPIDEKMLPNIYVTVMAVKGAGTGFDEYIDYSNKEKLLGEKETLDLSIKEIEEEIAELISSMDHESVSSRNEILISRKERELSEIKEKLQKNSEELDRLKDKNITLPDVSFVKPDFKFGVVNLIVNKRDKKVFIDITSSKASYKVGDKVSIDIRTRDYQNRPIPAVVSLAVVDESLLALKANQKVDPLDYFYGQRALQVYTATNLTIHIDRTNIKSQQGAKGGDGAGSEGFEKKRGDFKDTAYFNPVIKTDSGGYARIEFDPPDNLTSWEIWAVASSKEDGFGMQTADFTVKKPLAATPILPRFAISGDQFKAGALVHNQTGSDFNVTVGIKTNGLTVKGASKKSLFVRDGSSERVDFQVIADTVSGVSEAMVEFSVQDSGRLFEDISIYSAPVYTFSFPEITAVNGYVEDELTEKIRIPTNIESGMGELLVRVGGSVLTGFIKQFKALADYPYGCAEQMTSQILPTLVILSQSAKNEKEDILSLLNINKEENAKIITNTLNRLSKFQRFDGGYGFWEGSSMSSPIITSYILYSQYLALESGFIVSDTSVKSAVQYLWDRLNEKKEHDKLSLNERAFILWVLSEAGHSDTGMTLSLYENRNDLSLYAQALMLMNIKNLYDQGQKSIRPFAEKLKSEIVSKQIFSDRTAHFEEDEISPWDMNTNRRATAMILMALNRDNPYNPILPKIVNYLVSSDKKSALTNTQEAAWILMAMLEYGASQDALNSDFTFSAKLNRQKFLDGAIDSTNPEQIFEKHFAISELKSGEELNELIFTKGGTGSMSYDLELKYYLPNEAVSPMEKGFFITRNYYEFETAEKNKIATNIKSDGIYRGELNIIVPEDMHYVVVEERLPSGFEAINFNLETTDASLRHKLQEETKPKTGEYYWHDNPVWRFNHTEMRDDRVLLFADYLPRGVYTYSFLVRAGLPGKYHHLPASAHQMYFPEVFGRTGGGWIEIKD